MSTSSPVTRRRKATPVVAVLVATMLTLVLAPSVAWSQGCVEWKEVEVKDDQGRPVGWETVCVRYENGTGGGGAGGVWLPTEGVYAISLTTVDGERCWRVIWIDLPGYERPPDAWTWSDAFEIGQDTWGDDYPQCPGADQADPTGAVRALWASASLIPDTELYVAPGWALAGLPAFLEIRGDRTLETTQSLPAPFNTTATLTASATYTVKWGDGEEISGVQSSGGPWPDGDLKHAYVTAEELEIEVIAEWVGEWSVGGGPARPLPAIQVPSTLPLEVREYRAVRVARD